MIGRIAQANALLIVQYAIGSMVPLLLIPHIVRSIGLTNYGHIAFVLACAGFGAIIVQYAFQLTGPARVLRAPTSEAIRHIFLEIFIAKSALLLGLLVIETLLFVVASAPGGKRLPDLLILYSVTIGGAANSVWFLQARDRFSETFVVSTAVSVFVLSAGFVLIRPGDQSAILWAVVISCFGPLAIGFGTLMISLFDIGEFKSHVSTSHVVTILCDDWPVFLSQFMALLYGGSGTIAVKLMLGAEAAGAYSVTERVTNAFVAAALLTHTAAYPRLVESYAKDRVAYWRIIKFVLLVYGSFTMVCTLLTLAFGSQLAYYLYNEGASHHIALLYIALFWVNIAVFGPLVTGYLTASNRKSEVLPLTLKVLAVSFVVGIPSVFVVGPAGWLVGLIVSQLAIAPIALKYWRLEIGTG